ncbi:MAG: hypothetical protein AAF911_04550 [Planctomycetota bacterium]
MSDYSPHLVLWNADDEVSLRIEQEISAVFANCTRGNGFMFQSQPPLVVELFNSIASWKAVLGVPATVFLASYAKKLGEISAEKTPALISEILGGATESCGKLFRLAKAFLLPKVEEQRDVVVWVGFHVEGIGRAKISIPSEDEVKLIEGLAWFVHNMGDLEIAVRNLLRDTDNIQIEEDIVLVRNDEGISVSWFDEESGPKHAVVPTKID